MLLTFDFSSDTPLYIQLRNQIIIGIADGRLISGEKLPTVRALAEESGINTMTVSKAYQLLKQEGYITTDRRSGAAVAPPASSTKGATGHLMGAGGLTEVIACIQVIREGVLPPTLNYSTPDPLCDLDYVPNTGRQQEMQYALSNSLGFGGHNACIALRRWEG